MIVSSSQRRYNALALGVYGANASSRGGTGFYMRPIRYGGYTAVGGVAGSDMGWPEFLGGAVAAEDDRVSQHSPLHALAIGIATGIAVHIAVKLIDRHLFGEK